MTKAAVRAMDTVQEFLGMRGIEIAEFIPIGGSKRAWTAWLTAAVDQRVKAVLPISIDLLHMDRQFTHHWEAYGFYSAAIDDYVEFDLPCRVRSQRGQDLLRLIDPYEYRERYTMPKLIVNSAGGQCFLPDSSHYYYGDLPEPKHLRYTFNTDHRQGDELQALLNVALAALAWVDDVNRAQEGPRFSWTFEPDGSIRVATQDRPSMVYLVEAINRAARDFRLQTIGAAWQRKQLFDQGDGTYVGYVEPPSEGWKGFAVELVYGQNPVRRQTFTTDVRIVPDYLPFRGMGCPAVFPGYLDNPQPGGRYSGIAIVSGWVYDADNVDARIDDGFVVSAGYGSPRGDTQAICGDRNNGFGLLFNLSLLGNGEHHLVAMADGRTIGAATFSVQTLGKEFLRDAEGVYRLANFPSVGTATTVYWEEALQNFLIGGVVPTGVTPEHYAEISTTGSDYCST